MKISGFNSSYKTNIKSIMISLMTISLGINFVSYASLNLDTYKLALRVIVTLLLIFLIFIKKNIKVSNIILSAVATYLILINGAASLNIAFLLLSGIALQDVDEHQLLKAVTCTNILIIVCVVILLQLGIINNIEWAHPLRRRFLLGFLQPNFAGILMFSTVSVFFLLKNNMVPKFYIPIILVSWYIYYLTDSRTSFFAEILMILLYYAFKYNRKKYIYYFCNSIILLCFISPFVWNNAILNSNLSNIVLSNRPMLYLEYINSNSIIDFLVGGSKIKLVDNFYLPLLYNCGIFIYTLFFIIMIKVSTGLLANNEYLKLSFFITVIIIGMMETFVFRPEILCMIVFWKIIFDFKNIKATPR